MRVKSIQQIPSPQRDGFVRLAAEVEYETPGLPAETYWFEVPDKYAPYLSETGNPWLVCLLPLAMVLNEPIRLCRPVDETLLAGIHQRMRIWKLWYPRLSVVSIEADTLEKPVENAGKTCSFFSGGVDAFFTVLYYDRTNEPYARIPIDELVNVWGYDVPLKHKEEYLRLVGPLRKASQELGKEFVDMASNLRETQLEKKGDWGSFHYGSALAAAGFALEKRYKLVLISSGADFRDISPNGSNPVTTHLSSSSRLQVRRAGDEFSRAKKTEYIAPFETVQRALHVCFHVRSEKNCGRCLKCYRTMMTLETLGILDRFKTFPEGAFTLARAAKMYLWQKDDELYTRDIERLALAKGRPDVAEAARASLRHSRRLRGQLSFIDPLRHKKAFLKLFWVLEGKLLAGSIGSEERYYPATGNSKLVREA